MEVSEKAAGQRNFESVLARLETENLILKEKHEQQIRYISGIEDKLKTLEADISAKSKGYSEKERQLMKLQTSLVIREEMLGREAKKLKAKVNTHLIQLQQIRDRENQLAQERQELDDTWDQVINQVETKDDTFRTQIYGRCKESLVKQRKMLTEEQQALDH